MPYSWDAEQPHRHSYSKVITNTTGPTAVEGIDGNGKPTVTYYYTDYWEEKCSCGATNGRNGSDTRRA